MPRIDLDWQDEALCREVPAEFYGAPADTAHARRVCRLCPVIAECLADSLARRDPYGVWGGISEQARRRILGEPEDDHEEEAA